MPDKLSIIPCTLNNSGSVSGTRDGEAFTAMLNPESFKHDKSINYSGMSKSDIKKAGGIPLGASAAMPRFKNTGSEKVSFSLTVDGTGVVPPNSENSGSISGKIKALSQVVYDYKGSSHEPNVVKLVWGSFCFYGRLTSMSTDYTLFTPDGEPLRAKVSLSFTDYTSIKEEALKANKSSPDLTHSIEVKAGDTLPLLCHRVYKDSTYYLDIARINGITNFRNIRPGMRLKFPPLK
ncbi:MAG: peptidoglycan-binding protein [Zetaproteobacteria bacterium CG06_land_8_20_14_3_00_59_53]|nr:MAG: peptidoglycan-binding protein [Zetaproteobacteria bacterium CG23_combo_of_CG06-09_8_20_14_all_59_86]PIQ64301.1 MAG: peptidoglycan-binding protein [Zetaproteobacteria bacterium CG11_big_fil_rev_8_21_14_0_20_59_439]PIU70354.1 MAG: peptidoglycan-binding protein [Zetaproteobacteria bacterium CG06_land_8_20_14_3_00_59_53]PIU96602.1 MAG: peptidoglycan-binding protein [Zetaproteobacteria bacterium CG03_land_8_20_14_0_80_59_51]PIY47483.1 MAG: peptidoglycan-binding protein [Zetaproteobacteria ba